MNEENIEQLLDDEVGKQKGGSYDSSNARLRELKRIEFLLKKIFVKLNIN